MSLRTFAAYLDSCFAALATESESAPCVTSGEVTLPTSRAEMRPYRLFR